MKLVPHPRMSKQKYGTACDSVIVFSVLTTEEMWLFLRSSSIRDSRPCRFSTLEMQFPAKFSTRSSARWLTFSILLIYGQNRTRDSSKCLHNICILLFFHSNICIIFISLFLNSLTALDKIWSVVSIFYPIIHFRFRACLYRQWSRRYWKTLSWTLLSKKNRSTLEMWTTCKHF